MYTNEKAYSLPACAKTALLSRTSLMSDALLAGGALSGGLLGLYFEQQAGETASVQAPAPDPPASSVLASRREQP